MKKAVTIIAIVLVLALAVGAVGYLSSGFKNWNAQTWFAPKFVADAEHFGIYDGVVGSYYGEEKHIVLPETVSTLESLWSSGDFSKVESVRIPATYTSIKKTAFDGCSNLKRVEILGDPKSVESDCFLNHPNTVVYFVEQKPDGYVEAILRGAKSVVWGYTGK